jgi:hypothetical protein
MATNIGFPESPKGHRNPWGLWATAGLSLLTYLLYIGAGMGVAVGAVVTYLIDNPGTGQREITQFILSDGTTVLSGLLVSGFLGTLLLLFLVRIRKGPPAREYLCLRLPAWKIFAVWILITVLFDACSAALSYLLDYSAAMEIWVELLQTDPPVPLVIVSVILMAPIFEEIFFRGFMFAGIKDSRLGAPGAIVITALTWSVIHFQYGLYMIATIFVLGIVLGMARLRTNSLYLTIAMHATVNAIAMVEANALA